MVVPTRPGVAAATVDDWRPLTLALADAFYDDPVFGWLLPDDARRLRALRRFFAVETRRIALPHAASVQAVDDGGRPVGAALVLPPDRWRTPLWVEAVFGPRYIQAFGKRLPRALQVITEMERRHLREPHVYFAYIGIVPSVQGTGRGSAMVSSVLDGLDRDGTIGYLEASNPRCAALYERLGFVGTDEISVAGSPPLRLMRRDPLTR